MAGIPKSTYYVWLQKARELDEARADPQLPDPADENELLLLDLLDAVQKGMAEGEALHLQTIRDASTGDLDQDARPQWQAAAWILERSRPSRWGRRDRHEISGPDGGPIVNLEVDPDDIDRLDEITAALLEAGIIDSAGSPGE